MKRTEYKLELANKIEGGRAVGNLYGVGRYVNDCRCGWALPPQEDKQRALNFVATANLAAEMVR